MRDCPSSSRGLPSPATIRLHADVAYIALHLLMEHVNGGWFSVSRTALQSRTAYRFAVITRVYRACEHGRAGVPADFSGPGLCRIRVSLTDALHRQLRRYD